VLFENTPFLTFEGLSALFVITPLDGIAHGRHHEILRVLGLGQEMRLK